MKAGDSLISLFANYRVDLLRFIGKKYGNRCDTEDIVQDAYCKLLESGKADSLENARAYLYQTANNLALNRIQKEHSHRSYVQKFDKNESTYGPEKEVVAHKELEGIDVEFNNLPEKYRKTFSLSRVEEMSYKEISQQLEIPVSTVEKHIIKVLKHLRQSVERHCG